MEPHGLRHYLRSHFLDTTFKGLYHANAFDLALLIPYFIVLVLLAAYGMHRYQLVYLYYKYRKNKVTEPESRFAELPQVTIDFTRQQVKCNGASLALNESFNRVHANASARHHR